MYVEIQTQVIKPISDAVISIERVMKVSGE